MPVFTPYAAQEIAMVSSTPAGSGLPIGLMPGALPSDHCSRQTLNTTAMRLSLGQSQSAFFMALFMDALPRIFRLSSYHGGRRRRRAFAGLQRKNLEDFVLDGLAAGALRG